VTSPEQQNIYKSNSRIEIVYSSEFDLNYLKDLLALSIEIHKKAVEIEINSLQKKPEQTDEDLNKIKEYCLDVFKLKVSIWGENGEFLVSESSDIFESPNFPSSVKKIVFDNSFDFNYFVKSNPKNHFKIILDFNRIEVFDFTINLSLPTENESSLSVIGEDEGWVESSFQKLKNSLGQHKKHREWLHRGTVYDWVLWFIIFPLSFWNLYKLDNYFAESFQKSSIVFQTAVFFYLFLIIVLLSRVLFSYCRWVFPYLELEKNGASKMKIHKWFFGVLILGVIIALIKDIVKYLLPFIF
jgi:lipid-A-disaccharide synthase-like uncharacterized protein